MMQQELEWTQKSAESRIQDAVKATSQSKAALEEVQRSHQVEMEDAHSTIASLMKSSKYAEDRALTAEDKLSNMQNRVASLEEDKNSWLVERNDLQAMLRRKMDESKNADEISSVVAGKVKQIATLESKLRHYQQQIEPLSKSNESLRQNLEQMNRLLESQQDMEQGYKEEIAKLKGEVSSSRSVESLLKSEQGRTVELQAELQTTRAEIHRSAEVNTKLESEMASLKERLNSQNSFSASQLRDMEHKHESELKGLKSEVALKDRDISALREDADSSKRRWQIVKAKMDKEHATKIEQLDILKSQLAEKIAGVAASSNLEDNERKELESTFGKQQTQIMELKSLLKQAQEEATVLRARAKSNENNGGEGSFVVIDPPLPPRQTSGHGNTEAKVLVLERACEELRKER
jgi:chromosome segregation ATPase